MKQHYKTLGVDENAGSSTILKAFRKKAKKVHPDVGGSPEAFSKLSEAYNILISPEKRRLYDNNEDVSSTLNSETELNQGGKNILLIKFESLFDKLAEDPISFDIIGAVKSEIEKEIRKTQLNIDKLKRNIRLLKFADKNVIHEGENNLLKTGFPLVFRETIFKNFCGYWRC